MIDEQVKFDERYDSEEYGTTSLYFTAPKTVLQGKYPDALHAEISIEYPTHLPEPKYTSVMISPTADIDGCLTDYDWCDIDLPYDEIEKLFRIANI